MRVIKINPQKPELQVINLAVKTLKEGGVVVYPTDTAYGLGVDALNEQAIGKLFIIKQRVQKPLPVIVSNFDMLNDITIYTEKELEIAKKYWPGPLTIIFKKKDNISSALTLGLPTIGVRIPDNKVAIALTDNIKRPLTSTSANISGKQNCYSAEEVERVFREENSRPDLILDAGPLPQVEVSTVIEMKDGRVKVIREGPVHVKF